MLLSNNKIFEPKGKKPQKPVFIQWACYLLCYGIEGGNICLVPHWTGIGHGTVFNCCKWVTRALHELKFIVVTWSNDRRHAASKAHFGKTEFDDCIGVVDGSLIELTAEPTEQESVYHSCKKDVAVCQICLVGNICCRAKLYQ